MKKVVFLTMFVVFGITTLGFSAAATKAPSNESMGTLGIVPGASLLEQTSQAFTQIAEKATPATVFIKAEITQQMQQQELMNPFDMFGDDFFRRFFGGGHSPFQQQLQPQQPQTQQSFGSGFLITADGYVVTNNHVIKDASHITIILNDGKEYPATVKGADSRTDLALLKIDEKNLPFLVFGDSDELKIGEWVVAIGNPFGLGATLTAGIVSAKGRQDLGIASYEDFIQTDAAINPGNSGGPLFNLKGEVIGVNTAIYTRSGGYMGIGLSIPSRMAQAVIEQIMETGNVKRGYLGIVLQPVDKELASALELENQEGALISEIVKGSPAAKSGLQQGDIILQYNDKSVKTVAKLRYEIGLMQPGSDLKLQILRSNKKLTLNTTLGSWDGEVISAELIQKIGIDIENINPETASRLGYNGLSEGVAISRVKPGSPAAQAGLRPGFLITGVAMSMNNPKSVKNTTEFEEALKEVGEKKHLILIVRHQNFQRYYTIKVN